MPDAVCAITCAAFGLILQLIPMFVNELANNELINRACNGLCIFEYDYQIKLVKRMRDQDERNKNEIILFW